MKVSTKGRYALRMMVDLAMYNTGAPVALKDIASRQEISEKYLEQIISVLNKAGFVRSIRGAQGGYVLTKKPSEYTVGMILRLIEGDLAPVECVAENAADCAKKDRCITVYVWERVAKAVNDVVDSITIEELAQRGLSMIDSYSI